MNRLLTSLYSYLVFTILGFIILFYYYNSSPRNESKVELFTVPRGRSLSYTAEKLREKQLIRSEHFFILMGKILNKDKSIKAGVYEIHTKMSTIDILNHLASGKVKMIQFTIIEGWTNEQIAEYFLKEGFIKDKMEFLNLTKSKEILDKYNIQGPTTEGFLFPETYTIDPQLKIAQIHEIMIQMFYRKLSEIISIEKINPEELYRNVIIASIIEREAIHKEELPIMASVYFNRLKKGMKLQADPTIQYILKNPKKKLTLKDLEIQSPYNTYRYKGLPPTPISNPGFYALRAVFYPETTDYYFFVLKPDGYHYFSKTYSEHLEAKRKYWDIIK